MKLILFVCVFKILMLYEFVGSQVATIIAVYASWGFARVEGMGWGWAGVVWLYSIVTYIPLDILKFIARFGLSGKAWDSMIENKVSKGHESNLDLQKLEAVTTISFY